MNTPSTDSIIEERRLCGLALISAEVLSQFSLNEDDFSSPSVRPVYKAMRDVYGRKGTVGYSDLEAMGLDIGFMTSLASEAGAVKDIGPTIIDQMSERIRDAAKLRRLNEQFQRDIMAGRSFGEICDALVTRVATQSSTEVTEGAMLHDAETYAIEELSKAGGRDSYIRTGFASIDGLTQGLPIGGLVCIGGRPGMGKSSLSRQVAFRVAQEGLGVHYFSMEDNRISLCARYFAERTGIPLGSILSGSMTVEQRHRVEEVKAPEAIPFYLEDSAGLNVNQIVSRCYAKREQLGTKLVVVDYLQYLLPENKSSYLDHINSSLSALASLARSMKVAVVLVCQLNRNLEMREDKRPAPSDFKDSGRIEEFAHALWALYRDEKYSGERIGEAELLVLKGKNTPTGTIDLTYDAKTTSFWEISNEAG